MESDSECIEVALVVLSMVLMWGAGFLTRDLLE